jgi:two-component system phosphate regulon sensor histidine kinase PhoR
VARALEAARTRWAREIHQLRTRVRENEIRLKLSEAERQHLETILDSLRDAVIVTDDFDEVSRINVRAAELLGLNPASDLHKPIDEVLSDERLRGLIRDVRAAGVLHKRKNVEHQLGDDGAEGRADIDVTLECLPDSQNSVGGVVTILRDVTREREISQMKSDFVSQASHELKTPLSSINAYVEMLLDGEAQDEDARGEFYQIIRSEAERVGRMIDNMLNISRIEAGIHSFDQAETDFVGVCREVIETMTPQAAAKGTRLSLKHGPLVYSAQADRDLVYQVVMNLASNAIKYTPEGGRVTITVENDDTTRSVLVRVIDTGLGIPPDAIDRVFDKFYRIENYKRVAKGTGLGLNLCKHIVETVHHGRIGVESEMGMGSRFWFSIPYSAEDAA